MERGLLKKSAPAVASADRGNIDMTASEREAFDRMVASLANSAWNDASDHVEFPSALTTMCMDQLRRAYQAATAHERERIQDAISIALQGDLENGVKWLNEAASCKFRKEYPALAKLIGDGLEDGRALREAIRCAK